jgi:ZIP family zinc transporter
MHPILNVFLLSLIAGLGTGLGGLLAILRKPGRQMYGFLMGIAAGVMITLSFLELVNEAWELSGFWTATIGFTAGAIFMFAIDLWIPHIRFGEEEIHSANPSPERAAIDHHSARRRRFRGGLNLPQVENTRLLKSGLLITMGITIHNIPEGIAVGAGYMHSPDFGVFIALAILLHNIPEGIAVALPLCESGVSRWNSFRLALSSGLVEPIGAIVAALFLANFEGLIPAALAFAGGVMVFITLDELVPAAREFGHQHFTAMGIILGAIFVFLLSGYFGV